MAKDLLDRLLDSIFDANWIGKHGEKLTERELKLVNLFGRRGKTLRNLYLPKERGETSEIDLVYLTQKGIFVFESKNYSGWIFGDEQAQYWTVVLPNKQKNRLYNPIKQNRTHLKWLGAFVGPEVPLFSIIVFSNRCELKQVTVNSTDVRVIKRDRTYAAVRDIWDAAPDALSDEAVAALYERLKPLTNVDEATKLAHVERIREQHPATTGKAASPAPVPAEPKIPSAPVPTERSTTEEAPQKQCPRCGKALVVRTARSGPRAGVRFFGCTGFPKCRYTEQIPNTEPAAPAEQEPEQSGG